jgi:hypothetical protein
MGIYHGLTQHTRCARSVHWRGLGRGYELRRVLCSFSKCAGQHELNSTLRAWPANEREGITEQSVTPPCPDSWEDTSSNADGVALFLYYLPKSFNSTVICSN